jgi:hypothetical protein
MAMGGISNYFSGKSKQRAEEKAARHAMWLREQAQNKAKELYTPYKDVGQTGIGALGRIEDILMGGDMSQFQTSPGYEFRLAEGEKALERSAAARGGLMGGRQMKAMTRYGQDYASNEFSNYLSQLSGLASQGINTGMAGARGIMAQYGQQVQPAMIGSGISPAANAFGSAGQGMAGIGGMMGQQKMMSSLMGSGGGGYGGGFQAGTQMPQVPSSTLNTPFV